MSKQSGKQCLWVRDFSTLVFRTGAAWTHHLNCEKEARLAGIEAFLSCCLSPPNTPGGEIAAY